MEKEIWVAETDSTMDAARRECRGFRSLLFAAHRQRKGRGTRGRSWLSAEGNIQMTVALALPPPGRLRLLALETGLVLHERLREALPETKARGLVLKWPNDILLEGAKAAGVLIETLPGHALVGIGINAADAPALPEGERPAACLSHHGFAAEKRSDLIRNIARDLVEMRWNSGSADFLAECAGRMDWKEMQRIRPRGGPEGGGAGAFGEAGLRGPEAVLPLRLNAEGHLLVRMPDGETRWLISDYLA